VPVVLAAPAAALVLVALATWRLERRLDRDVRGLADSTQRLASLREAVAALGAEITESGERHEGLQPDRSDLPSHPRASR
jgi:type II secretory pathway component PulJ